MRVIGVVGYPASGKGEFSRVAKNFGIPVVVMGDIIRMKAAEDRLPETDAALGEVAKRLRAEHGMDAIALLTIPAVEALGAPLVVIDGIRGDAEVRRLREHFPGFILVGVVSPFQERLFRLPVRGRSDDLSREEDLRNRDSREEGFGLGRALAEADRVLENNGPLDDFQVKVKDLIEDIRRSG
jgi:dephospho-CoA kinase